MCLRRWSHGSPNKSKMAAAAIFNFGKMSLTPHWIKISAQNFTERCITAMRKMTTWPKVANRKLIRMTSSNERQNISASISMTSADILTQFGTEHKYHTVNTPEWPNSHNLFRLCKFGHSGVVTVWYLCSVPNWVKISALVTEIDALMLQTLIWWRHAN